VTTGRERAQLFENLRWERAARGNWRKGLASQTCSSRSKDGRHRPAWRGIVRAGISPLQWPQPRRVSGQRVIQSAAHLNAECNAPRSGHHM
jgi:hypothetical protein